jgi:GNAT superfamily N-acetyltransferase
MGVRQAHQSQGLDALLYEHILDVSRNNGVHTSEASWVLETNTPMINTMIRAGARPWRRYRMLCRPL